MGKTCFRFKCKEILTTVSYKQVKMFFCLLEIADTLRGDSTGKESDSVPCVNSQPSENTSLSPLLVPSSFLSLYSIASPLCLPIGQTWSQQRRETARGGGKRGREREFGYEGRTKVETKKRCRCVELGFLNITGLTTQTGQV